MSDRGEPRSWDPTTPGICALWFDATTITGVANGATITSWVPRGPAVNIEHATFASEVDVDLLMRRAAWMVQTERV